MEELLRDIRALLFLQRAQAHRNAPIKPDEPDGNLETFTSADQDSRQYLKWPEAFKRAAADVKNARDFIEKHPLV